MIVLIFAQPTFASFSWGIFLMVLGELIRIWGVAYAGGATRTRNVGAPELVTSGPFARVRNPLYIGNMLMYTGAAVIANVWQPWLVIFIWVFFGVQYYFIVNLEEEELNKIFGGPYHKYCKNVNRFIPNLRAYKINHQNQPDYKMALISEKSTFISFLTILILMAGKMYLNQP